jgi:hypothetical protein
MAQKHPLRIEKYNTLGIERLPLGFCSKFGVMKADRVVASSDMHQLGCPNVSA